MTEFLAKAFFSVIEMMHSFTGSYGVDLVLLTVMVKTALYPLTFQQMKNQRLMQKMAPELKKFDSLKSKNPQEYQQKTMELYKKNNTNPLAGCVPMFIQFPIIIALFRMLRDYSINNGAFLTQNLFGVNLGATPVGTVPTLSEAQRLPGSTALPSPWGNDPSFISFYWPALLLLAFYLLTTILYQNQMMPAKKEGEDAPPMPFNPKIFTFMILIWGLFFPAGLIFYFIVFNVVSIFQTKMIYKKLDYENGQK